jgi:hypothetical protein
VGAVMTGPDERVIRFQGHPIGGNITVCLPSAEENAVVR